MTREELGNNISANIASVTMGCTNIEVTSAIMKDVDLYAPRRTLKSTQAMRDRIRELMSREQDDYDRAVECVVDDLEALLNGAPAQRRQEPEACPYAIDGCVLENQEIGPCLCALTSSNAPAAQGAPATGSLLEEAWKRYPQTGGTHRQAFIEGAQWAAVSSTNAPAAQGTQPVAWRWRSIFNEDCWTLGDKEPAPHEQYIVEPLYATPSITLEK